MERERLGWADAYRGLAVVGVLLLHVSGRFMGEVAEGGPAWSALALLNRSLGFVVPSFLSLSAVLLGLGALRGGRPLWARLLNLAWPYLVWSTAYLLLRAAEGTLPPLDAGRLGLYLGWGKAYFHLYYLALALQLALLVWLLRPLLGRGPLAAWGLAGVALGVGAYWANRLWWQLPFPGSSLLFYLPNLALALGLLRRGAPDAPSAWAYGLPLLAAGAALHLPLALGALRENPVDTFAFQLSFWLYSGAAALVLLGAARALSGSRPLNTLGRYSLQIYLLHPLVMWALERSGAVAPLRPLPEFLAYFALALLVPLALARAVGAARGSALLFGR